MDKTVTTQQCVELVSNQQISNMHFTKSLATIKVAQIIAAARPVAEKYDTERRWLLEEMGTTDPETGNLASNPDGTLKFKTATGRKEFDAKHKELLDVQTTVAMPNIAAADLEADSMTTGLATLLLPFVNGDNLE